MMQQHTAATWAKSALSAHCALQCSRVLLCVCCGAVCVAVRVAVRVAVCGAVQVAATTVKRTLRPRVLKCMCVVAVCVAV